MIITDFNEMSIEELSAINRVLQKEYIVENGKITGIEVIPAKQITTMQG